MSAKISPQFFFKFYAINMCIYEYFLHVGQKIRNEYHLETFKTLLNLQGYYYLRSSSQVDCIKQFLFVQNACISDLGYLANQRNIKITSDIT